MAELKAVINLEDNFSAQIKAAIDNTDIFKQAVSGAKNEVNNFANQNFTATITAKDEVTDKIAKIKETMEGFHSGNFEATIMAKDEATEQISKTKKALSDIKKSVLTTIGAKDEASSHIATIRKNAEDLVKKNYRLEFNAIDKTKSVIKSVTDSIFSLKTLAAGIILGGTAKEGFDWTIKNSMENENYLATLQTVLHSEDKGKEALKWSYNDAASTPFDAKQVVAGVTQLSTSGLDYEKYLNPLGDAAAAMNKPLEQAIFAMSKLKSGQLGMAVDMFRDFGISNQDWTGAGAKFAKNGEMIGVTPQQAVDMVTKIINDKYGGLMDRKSSTADGMLSNMGDSISSVGRGLAGIDSEGQMMEGGLFDNFKKQLANIAPILDGFKNSNAFTKLQTDIGNLATIGGEKLTSFLEGFKDPEIIQKYEDTFSSFIDGLKEGANTAIVFGKAVFTVGSELKPVFDLIIAHPNIFLGLFAGFEVGKGAFTVMQIFKDVKKEIPGAVEAVKSFGNAFGGVFKDVGIFLKNNPIIIAITATVAVVTLLYEAWTNDWGGIREKTEYAVNIIKEKFDTFKKFVIDLKDNGLAKIKESFDNLKNTIIEFKDNAVAKAHDKLDDFKKSLEDNKGKIEAVSAVLGTIFGPALLVTGTRAAIAGGQIAAQFIANVIKTGTEAAINGARVTASFVASMIESGIEAVASGAKITASFIAGMARAGTEAVISGIKITASFIGSITKAGIEAVTAGGRIAISLIGSLLRLSAQAIITATAITGSLITSLVSYAAQGWKTIASIALTTGAWVAQKVVLLGTTVATYALEAAQWALNVAMDANPIGIVILAIGALGLAIYEGIKHWQDIRDWIMKVWDIIDNNPILKFISFALNPLGTAIMECVTHWNEITGAIKGAWDWLTSWVDKWNGTKLDDKNVTINKTVNSKGDTSDGDNAGKNALGTSFWKGGLTWVGEKGPELIDLQKGAKVYDNRTSMNMVNGIDNNPDIINSLPTNFSKAGEDIPTSLAKGIKRTSDVATDSITKMSEDVLKTFGTGITDNSKYATKATDEVSTSIQDVFGTLAKQSNPLGKNVSDGLKEGMQSSTSDVTEMAKTLTDKVIETFKTGFDIHSPSRILHIIGGHVMQGFINGMGSKDVKAFADKHVKSVIGAFGSAVNLPGGVSDWLTKALMATGTPLNWLPGLQKLVMAESGGDPNEVNNQSVGGEYATGLLQTLPSTFKEYMQKGMNNILNPVDNASAAINYIKSRYGDVYNTPLFKGGSYVGYATGTEFATPGYHWVGEKGPELMKFNGGEKVINHKDSQKAIGGNKFYIKVNIEGNAIGNEELFDQCGEHIADKILTVLETNV